MLRSLAKLTWLEIKIFVREPLGLVGAIAIPIAVFLFLGRMSARRRAFAPGAFASLVAPIFGVLVILLTATISLVTIIAIYREGGILKRLRATPLRPYTILTAHVLVKLLLTALTLGLMLLAGRRYYPIAGEVPIVSFTAALLVSGVTVLSMGFLIASLVPTARFAQPIGAAILYPMLLLSGLFLPLETMPPALRMLTRCLPLTYAVSLLKGIWTGAAWSAHVGDVAALVAFTIVFVVLSTKVFRWE